MWHQLEFQQVQDHYRQLNSIAIQNGKGTVYRSKWYALGSIFNSQWQRKHQWKENPLKVLPLIVLLWISFSGSTPHN